MATVGLLLAWICTVVGSARKCGRTSRLVSLVSFNLKFLILSIKQKHHINVFLSLSKAINGRSPNYKQLIDSASPNRLLVESDYHDVQLSTPNTVSILQTIAEVKGWNVEEEWKETLIESEWGAVRKLEANWKAFVAGNHVRPVHIPSKNRRYKQDWISDEESD